MHKSNQIYHQITIVILGKMEITEDVKLQVYKLVFLQNSMVQETSCCQKNSKTDLKPVKKDLEASSRKK